MKRNIKPFINAIYYNDVSKPHINARIEGAFLNVEKHKAMFDNFVAEASNIVDRLLNNHISEIGGIEYLSEYSRNYIKLATAKIVESWYLKGYNLQTIESDINIGSLQASQKKEINTFRNLLPLNAIAYIQKSGLWKNKVIGVELENEANKLGFDASQLLFLEDAISMFELKGEGETFHHTVNFDKFLGHQTNKYKYINIVNTKAKRVVFEVFGGGADTTKSLIEIERDKKWNITNENVFIYHPSKAVEVPKFYYKIKDNHILIYIRVKDTTENPNIIISNVFYDKHGHYGALGSKDTDAKLTLMTENSVLGKIAKVGANELNTWLKSIGLPQNNSNTIEVSTYLKQLANSLMELDKVHYQANGVSKTISEWIKEIKHNELFLRDEITDIKNKLLNIYTKHEIDGKITPILTSITNVEKHNTTQDGKITAIETKNTNQDTKIANLETHNTQQDTKIDNNKKRIDTQDIDISKLKQDDINQEGRLASIENGLKAIDNVWSGDKTITASENVSNIPGSKGTFIFKGGSKILITAKENTSNNQDTKQLITNSTSPTHFNISGKTLNLKLNDKGLLTATGDITDFHIIRVEQHENVVINTSYSKGESDKKYVAKTVQTTKDNQQDKEIAKKQNSAVPTLPTNDKTIVGAIKENFNNIGALENRSTSIESLKVNNGTSVVDINGMTGGTDDKIFASMKEVNKKANKDLSNVNVGVANKGKILLVNATGGLDKVSLTTIKVNMEKTFANTHSNDIKSGLDISVNGWKPKYIKVDYFQKGNWSPVKMPYSVGSSAYFGLLNSDDIGITINNNKVVFLNSIDTALAKITHWEIHITYEKEVKVLV